MLRGAPSRPPSVAAPHPGTANCSVDWHTQPLDHFSFTETRTFEQRVFSYVGYWRRPNAGSAAGPILFYCGNEASVELYVNATGWMWEHAEELGALLVFAEHRYYGESIPYAPGTKGCMSFLTTEQAMADFAYLIDHLRDAWGARHSAFIGFSEVEKLWRLVLL